MKLFLYTNAENGLNTYTHFQFHTHQAQTLLQNISLGDVAIRLRKRGLEAPYTGVQLCI